MCGDRFTAFPVIATNGGRSCLSSQAIQRSGLVQGPVTYLGDSCDTSMPDGVACGNYDG